jgi:hypothetical protein
MDLVVELGDDDVSGVERVREHGHGFFIQYDTNRAEGPRFKANPPLGSSRYPFVDPGRYFAVNQKRVAAVSEVSTRPSERDQAAGSFVTVAERSQT